MEHTQTVGELLHQIAFLIEIDKLKSVNRRSKLVNGSRFENSAEHSWHVAICAAVLEGYAAERVEISRVILMLLVHDIVEIDAGDTFAYDDDGRREQEARESAASERLFGLLPQAQAKEMLALWREFDAEETADSRFAHAVDRIMPVLHNYYSGGGSWREHGVSHAQVLARVACMKDAAPDLWQHIVGVLDDSVDRGFLLP